MADENIRPHNEPDNCNTCNNGLSGGQVALIILACVLVIGLIAALIAWLMQKKNKNKSSSKTNSVTIGGPLPQYAEQPDKNIPNQQSQFTNQSNTQAPQNNQAPTHTTINQQDLIANAVASATPQIIASMAKMASQDNDPDAMLETKKEEITEKKDGNENLSEPQTTEEKTDDIEDKKPNEEEEKERQKTEQSDLGDIFKPKPFTDFPTGKMIDNNSENKKNDNLEFPSDFTHQRGDVEKIMQTDRLKNPFEQLPLDKEIDNINGLKEQDKQDQTQQENVGNNIAPGAPKLDFASIFGLPSIPEKTVNEPKVIPEEKRNDVINVPTIKLANSGKAAGSPELKAGGRIDMLNQNGNFFAPDLPSASLNNNQQIQYNPMEMTASNIDIKNNNIGDNDYKIPPVFNYMSQSQNNIQQIDEKPKMMNNTIPGVSDFDVGANGQKNARINELPTIGQLPVNNISDSIPIPMTTSPINGNKMNYNNPLGGNIIPPICAIGNTDVDNNRTVIPSNPTLSQPQPINEDDIKPDAPIFTPITKSDVPSFNPIDHTQQPITISQRQQDNTKQSIMIPPQKEEPFMGDLPIPGQIKIQDKEKDSKAAGTNIAFDPFIIPDKGQNVSMNNENNNPTINEFSGLDSKQMEANNGQSQMNLGTQNKCMCPSCTGGKM